jgi:NADH-quinone oxidoreductase subunit L
VAGKKAFVTNRIGDWGFLVAMFFTFATVGSLNYVALDNGAASMATTTATAIAVLLFVGAVGKSAQFPLFERAPDAAAVGAIIGCVTLIIAATIGLVVTDLKRVIAYSTVSQLGYMFLAVGVGAYWVAIFHMITHAFFKACMFLGSGSVIHGMHDEQDMRRMGNLRKYMPITAITFMCGWLAIAGIPPFSGFWSKDEIIALEFDRGGWHTFLGVAAYLGAFLTAIYTFRMIFRAFHGEQCPEAEELAHGHLYHAPEPTNPATGEVEDTEVGFPGPEHHIAERAGGMKIAMGSLAVLAIVGGFLQIPGVTSELHHFLEPTFADSELYETLEPSTSSEWIGLIIGAVIGLSGIGVAWTIWGKGGTAAVYQARLGGLHKFFFNKWYFDEVIDFLIVRPAAWLGRFANSTFERVFVNGALVGGSSGLVRVLSAAVRGVQSGYLRYYAALLLVGLTGLSAYFLISA